MNPSNQNKSKLSAKHGREQDVDRILVFGSESDLDDLVKYKDCAYNGTFKCSSDIYYQL